jgi:hypothetical protein
MFIKNNMISTSSLYERAGNADVRPLAEALNENREGLLFVTCLPNSYSKLVALEQFDGLVDLPGGN